MSHYSSLISFDIPSQNFMGYSFLYYHVSNFKSSNLNLKSTTILTHRNFNFLTFIKSNHYFAIPLFLSNH